jgi:histidine triad (HIT) family protein
MDCIFCKIVAGEIPCSKVYEDDKFIAFLDINPVHKGHTLIVPKKHFVNVFDTPEEEAALFYGVISKIAKAVKAALGCDGINVIQNNEAAAGQEVFHSHVHIIPRYEEDKIKGPIQKEKYDDFDEMGAMAEKIAGNF